MTKFHDNFPTGSIVALVTPFDDDGAGIDLEAWRGLLRWHLDAGTDGVVVAGTTGESANLDAGERDALLESALEHLGGQRAVIAGTGSASTRVAVEQSRRAAALGADAVLVVTPYYNRPPQRGLVAHYLAIAEATPVPVVLYNVPSRTAADLAPESVLELAAHDNIIAIKEAVPDMDRVRRYVEAGMPVLSGDDPSALDAMRNGARGVISVAANVVPGALSEMCRRAAAGDLDGAAAIDRRLHPLYRFLARESNPLPVKWLLMEMGRIGSGLRLPLVPLDPAHHDDGRSLLDALSAAE